MSYPAVGTEERRELDLAMMRNPSNWPMGRTLPLKRIPGDGSGMSGRLEIPEGGGPVEPVVVQGGGRSIYPSFEAILDAGWTVD